MLRSNRRAMAGCQTGAIAVATAWLLLFCLLVVGDLLRHSAPLFSIFADLH